MNDRWGSLTNRA